MIIKSMSRKHRSFSQLYRYMEKGSSRSSKYDSFTKNLYSTNESNIIDEFLRNSRLLKTRANGNYLFHEVISLTKSGQLTLLQEKERLYYIVIYYTQLRCDKNLVVGFLHDEKLNNIHYHLMISSNEVGERKNQRLSKFEFDEVKKETEKYVICTYPELEQQVLINAKKSPQKLKRSNKAGEMQRKGSRLLKKERIITKLKDIFAQSQSKDDFFRRLDKHRIELYSRGNTIGFINKDDQKKYRLKTLALESEYQRVDALMTQQDKTKRKTHKQKQSTNSKKHQAKQDKKDTQSHNPESEIDQRKEKIKQSRTKSTSNREKHNNRDKC